MIFWRKQKKADGDGTENKEKDLVQPAGVDVPETAPVLDAELSPQSLEATESEILLEIESTPTPEHMPIDDVREAHEVEDDHSQEGGWFSRLSKGLSKSTGRIGQGITDIFTKRKLDDEALQDLEDLLISADLGPKTAAQVVTRFSSHKFEKDVAPDDVKEALAEIIAGVLSPVAQPLAVANPENGPFVILVCGVNGAGKTTTIGKLAYEWHVKQNRKVMIAAADTFRAAAVDQLEIWAGRAHVPLFKKDIGADAAAVAFEAYEKAKAEGAEILMIDTAGRLQNKSNLMAELQKVVRVLKKHDPSLPHAAVLVLDATTGQNAHSQVKIFKEAVDVTGLMVTKLDGSARGGVVVSLAQEFGLPIHAIGVGEKIEDLSPFTAKDFARALIGIKH